MNIFITTIPLFDAAMESRGYYLQAQAQNPVLGAGSLTKSEEFATPGLDIVSEVGPRPFAGSMPLFVDISRFQLFNGIPPVYGLPPEKMTCVLSGASRTDEQMLEKVSEAKKAGYSIAMGALPENDLMDPCMEYADYLFVKANHPQFSELMEAIPYYLPQIKVIAAEANFEAFGRLGSAVPGKMLFMGNFYCNQIIEPSGMADPITANIIQLLRQVGNIDFEFAEIIQIIERDVELTHTMLHFLNMIIAQSRRGNVVTLHQALTLLGQLEVRRWALISICLRVAQNCSAGIIRLALIRAQFAANLAELFQMKEVAPSLFLSGLFSLLDIILQRPLKEVLWEVTVDPRIYTALINKTGDFAPVMELVQAYEQADWSQVFMLMIRNRLDIEQISTAYLLALTWFDQVLGGYV